MCVCVCARVRACARARACVRAWVHCVRACVRLVCRGKRFDKIDCVRFFNATFNVIRARVVTCNVNSDRTSYPEQTEHKAACIGCCAEDDKDGKLRECKDSWEWNGGSGWVGGGEGVGIEVVGGVRWQSRGGVSI